MPLFEFLCEACGHRFEELVRAGAAADETDELRCAECGTTRVIRLPSAFAAQRGSDSAGTRRGVAASSLPLGGCGRCGDPNGPCGL